MDKMKKWTRVRLLLISIASNIGFSFSLFLAQTWRITWRWRFWKIEQMTHRSTWNDFNWSEYPIRRPCKNKIKTEFQTDTLDSQCDWLALPYQVVANCLAQTLSWERYLASINLKTKLRSRKEFSQDFLSKKYTCMYRTTQFWQFTSISFINLTMINAQNLRGIDYATLCIPSLPHSMADLLFWSVICGHFNDTRYLWYKINNGRVTDFRFRYQFEKMKIII